MMQLTPSPLKFYTTVERDGRTYDIPLSHDPEVFFRTGPAKTLISSEYVGLFPSLTYDYAPLMRVRFKLEVGVPYELNYHAYQFYTQHIEGVSNSDNNVSIVEATPDYVIIEAIVQALCCAEKDSGYGPEEECWFIEHYDKMREILHTPENYDHLRLSDPAVSDNATDDEVKQHINKRIFNERGREYYDADHICGANIIDAKAIYHRVGDTHIDESIKEKLDDDELIDLEMIEDAMGDSDEGVMESYWTNVDPLRTEVNGEDYRVIILTHED